MKRALCPSIALMFFLVACDEGNVDPQPRQESSQDPSTHRLYYNSLTLWSDPDIPVCWLTSGDQTEKRWVREALLGQRSWAAGAKVNLLGWDDCGPGDDTGIQLFSGDKMRTYTLGESPVVPTQIELDFRPGVQNGYFRCSDNGLSREECIKTVALHEFGHALAFAHEHNRADTPASCTAAHQGSYGDMTFGEWDPDSIMNYCDYPPQLSALDRLGSARLYGASVNDRPYSGDYNGDGRDDLLCHSPETGYKSIDYADGSGEFWGTNWSHSTEWCDKPSQRLFKGDFDGNGQDDLLCHDVANGYKWIDYSNGAGQYHGTNWEHDAQWCDNGLQELFIGDFDGDGRDDMLCHDGDDGYKWIDFANGVGHFFGTDWSRDAGWCFHPDLRLHIGDFDGDGRDDLLCQSLADGYKWIDFANAAGEFNGTDWEHDTQWCADSSQEIFVGDFNGDGHDDLLCHDAITGQKWVDLAGPQGQLLGTNWTHAAQWCDKPEQRVFVGDYDGNGRDDLLCHDVVTGKKWIDYANAAGEFNGTDWSREAQWCASAQSKLH